MRHLLLATVAIVGFGIFPALARAEERDSTGMPGDNFDLQGAMELFRTSKSLEAFEKALNTEKNAVNNLDLNGDGKTDYIAVFDKGNDNGNNHAVIMRVAINEKESQDVAAIAIQKTGEAKAQLQIIGNKELYGEEKIMEPYSETEAKQQGPAAYSSVLQPAIVFVNVWGWPCVSSMYGPYYSYYSSPWYWGYYPGWWDPWAPYYWYDYYPRVHHYHYMYYHTAYACYVPAAQNVYYSHRASSPTVNNRYAQARQNYNAPQSRATREAGRATTAPETPKTQTRDAQSVEKRAVSPTSRPTAQPAQRPAVREANPPQDRPQQPAARPVPESRPTREAQPVPQTRPAPVQRPAPQARPAPMPRQAPAPSARPAPVQRQAPPMRSAPQPMRRGGR